MEADSSFLNDFNNSPEVILSQQIEKEFIGIVTKHFPNFIIPNSGANGKVFEVKISDANNHYQSSEYYYDSPLSFFHLTTPKNIFSILNSRSFRLYNLPSSNDEKEYNYIADELDLSEELRKHVKKRLFTLSFCPINETRNEEIWRNYGGGNYNGVAIAFEIMNSPINWHNYHISRVKYGKSDTLFSYRDAIRILKQKYPGFDFNLHFINKLCAFHKEKEKWGGEKEVRLMTYSSPESLAEEIKFHKKDLIVEDGRNRIVDYIDLPLWVNNSELYNNDSAQTRPELDHTQHLDINYFNENPQIRIKDIIWGENSGLNDSELASFQLTIKRIIKLNFGYDVHLTPKFQKVPLC